MPNKKSCKIVNGQFWFPASFALQGHRRFSVTFLRTVGFSIENPYQFAERHNFEGVPFYNGEPRPNSAAALTAFFISLTRKRSRPAVSK